MSNQQRCAPVELHVDCSALTYKLYSTLYDVSFGLDLKLLHGAAGHGGAFLSSDRRAWKIGCIKGASICRESEFEKGMYFSRLRIQPL